MRCATTDDLSPLSPRPLGPVPPSPRPWRALAQVTELDGYGYDCFLEGNPHTVKLSGCWEHTYETHAHSNVACVLRTDRAWWRALMGLAKWLEGTQDGDT